MIGFPVHAVVLAFDAVKFDAPITNPDAASFPSSSKPFIVTFVMFVFPIFVIVIGVVAFWFNAPTLSDAHAKVFGVWLI